MDLSLTLRELKPGILMMHPKYFLGIVFEKNRYSGLEIFLDYDGIVIYLPRLFCYTFERDGWISCNLLLAFNSLSISCQWDSAQDKVTNIDGAPFPCSTL
jgi:hypothetical protein